MKIKDVLEEAGKLEGHQRTGKGGHEETTPSLIHVLIEIESTIRHLSTLYASPEITTEKKAEFEKMIKEADTRAMAVLTVLRNKP